MKRQERQEVYLGDNIHAIHSVKKHGVKVGDLGYFRSVYFVFIPGGNLMRYRNGDFQLLGRLDKFSLGEELHIIESFVPLKQALPNARKASLSTLRRHSF